MERRCFIFELKNGAEGRYEETHREVWPEMLALLDEAGVYDYSIFRDGTRVYAFLKVKDSWDATSRILGESPVQARWETFMAPLIAWQKDDDGNLHFAHEVFRHDGLAR